MFCSKVPLNSETPEPHSTARWECWATVWNASLQTGPLPSRRTFYNTSVKYENPPAKYASYVYNPSRIPLFYRTAGLLGAGDGSKRFTLKQAS